MMRNDVKLGLAVGGVLLAVLIVYVLVVPGGSEPGVELVTVDGTVAPDIASDIDQTADTPIGEDQLALLPDGTPRIRDTAADPFANSRNRTTRDDDGQRATSNGTAGGWDWARLLNGESAPTLMTETDVPTDHGTTSASEPSPGVSATTPAGTDEGILPAPGQPTGLDATPPSSVGPRNALIIESEPASPMASVTDPAASGTSPATGTPTGAPAPAPAANRTHVVQPGETFSSIALAAYGGSRYYAHIQRANPSVDPIRLKPGMTIVIPPLTDVRPDGAGPVAPQATLAAGGTRTGAAREQQPIDARTEYRVAPNDSLYKIAVKLYGDGIRHAEIYELNKQLIGPDPARLKVGTVLKLPAPPTSHMSTAAGR